MSHVYSSILNLLASFTFDEDKEVENVLQPEECNISGEMENMSMPKDMESVNEQNDLEMACEELTELSSGNSSSLNPLKLSQEEQTASEFHNFMDEYGLHCSEDISQQPNVMESEKHPSWLIDHLDGIKETLEKELVSRISRVMSRTHLN